MPLPPDAGLSAFVFGALGWYGTVRNGLQLFYDDLRAAREANADLKDLLDTMDRHEQMLHDWEGEWLVFEKTPESLYEEYWGDRYRTQVRQVWDTLERKMDDAKKVIDPYERLYEKQQQKGKAAVFLKKLLFKMRYVSMRKKHLDPLIKTEIPRVFADIEKTAKEAWNAKRGRDRAENVQPREIRHVAIQHLLVPIAMRTSEVMDDLRSSCRSMATALTTELELDLFGASQNYTESRDEATSAERSEYLRRVVLAAESKRLKLGILARDHGAPEDFAGHMDLVEVELAADNRVEATNVMGELQAFRRIIDGSNSRSLFVTQQNYRFVVTKPDRTHRPNPERHCFWVRPADTTNVADLPLSSKYRAAFELAQACLLFLNSEWFSELCSCGLRCGRLNRPGFFTRVHHEFALRTRPPNTPHEHLESTDDQSIDAAHTRLTRSMRRLGLLLIELHRLAVIRNLTCTREGMMCSMSIMKAEERVNKAANEVLGDDTIPAPYRGAVEYCLTADFQDYILTSREHRERKLKDFYENVVQPLKNLYDEAQRGSP